MRRLLRWLLPEADRRAFESEQAELYEARRLRDGDRRAADGRRADRWVLVWRLIGGAPSTARGGPTRGRPGATSARRAWPRPRARRPAVPRSLSRSPALAATIVLTVGLGLGATTAIVSVIRAVVLNPLPYRDASRLVQIRTEDGDNLFSLSVVDYQALAAQQTTLERVAASQTVSVTIAHDGLVERERGRVVTSGYLSLLGLTPAVGRLFDASDEQAGARAVILTEPYWRTRFGGSAALLGTTIVGDGAPRTVVGMLAPSTGPLEQDLALFEESKPGRPRRAKGRSF